MAGATQLLVPHARCWGVYVDLPNLGRHACLKLSAAGDGIRGPAGKGGEVRQWREDSPGKRTAASCDAQTVMVAGKIGVAANQDDIGGHGRLVVWSGVAKGEGGGVM